MALRFCGNGAGSDRVVLSGAGEGSMVALVLCDAYMGTMRHGCQRTEGGVQLLWKQAGRQAGRRGGVRKGCWRPGVAGANLSAQRGMGLTKTSGGTQRKAAHG